MVLPDPEKLRQVLAVARDFGVQKLRVGGLDVTFAAAAETEPLTPFRDKDGKPVDLDEGMPPLAADPEFASEGDDPVVRANFAPHDAKQAKAS